VAPGALLKGVEQGNQFCQMDHAIEDGTANARLDLLVDQLPGSQAGPQNGFVSPDHGFHQTATMIATAL